MVRVKSSYPQPISARVSFPLLALRQNCRDHPMTMFNGIVFAAFVWTLVPTGFVPTPLSVWTAQPGRVEILRTTAKTSRLPKPDDIRACPKQDRGRDWLECLTEFAYGVGKVEMFLG
jgi:hypothetical protein